MALNKSTRILIDDFIDSFISPLDTEKKEKARTKAFDIAEDLLEQSKNSSVKIEDLATKVETKAEIQKLGSELRSEIQELRTETKADIQELRAEIQELRAETKAEIQELRAETKIALRDTKHDVLKWMVSLSIAIVGILIAVIKL